ncbi:response regulator transcription factor [Garciella nitratireducens]|uniref:Stage 0 sporulation protein A homolog n=1 Tax=Garciella nitratireducens DSM 15102 TaxID=1121911 RepID=A0A1T4NNH0_9FIRM|nr:response regulator transcription factor [Garciella nitratireducens]SJZ80774.1 DNA-binding response regulator, OmpR family, contains REC and winged-helix (wHTH) domain [Garciella nitratireducens DSM 15102]
MGRATILVVDDDKEIANAIEKLLNLEGYEVVKAYNGIEVLDILVMNNIQLILLDVMMPKLDGLSTMMKIRLNKNIPIIILSAKSENSDKILGLSMGADDYVTKPFDPQELVARVKSQLRRYMQLGDMEKRGSKSSQIIVGGLSIDTQTKEFIVDGEFIKLTPTEFKIMEFLMSHPGRVFSAEQIYERVWKEPAYSVENTVMVHIRRIREKIEINPKEPKYLKVVWGIGYKIERYS